MPEYPQALSKACRAIHYLYPPFLFICFIVMQGITVCTLGNLRVSRRKIRRNLMIFLQTVVIVTYVAEAILMLARSLIQNDYFSPEHSVLYVLSSLLAWAVVELSLLDSGNPVWYPYYVSWLIALAAEMCLLAILAGDRGQLNGFQWIKALIEVIRIVFLCLLPLCFWGFQQRDNKEGVGDDEESAGLLAVNGETNGSTNGVSYGATDAGADDPEEAAETREARVKMMKKIEESGNWWVYAKSFAVFWPYIWPSKDRGLQASMALVAICLLVERGLNVLVPHQLGVVTDALAEGSGIIPWFQVSLYVLYRWLDSGSGISALQRYLWMPVDQYSYRSITTAAYNHVMSLSHDFHTNKKTGELYTSVNQGRSVNGFIESILFAVLPMLADLCVAFGYFYIVFNAYMALIVAVVSVVYLWATAKLGSMRNQMRRDFNSAARKESNIMWETMSSWTTVSYFNRIEYEQDRYFGAVTEFQQAERGWYLGISLLNVSQSLIFTIGLLGASFLAVYEVSIGEKPVGSFVSLLSYWAQLSSPLSFFANFYRKIQNQMLDAERLLELFQTKPSIGDKPGAKDLEVQDGEIEFDDVKFSYDPRKPAISGMSFKAPGGSTVALVGETGGGKTTCLKLLFRFFDVTSGSIRVDGQDIRDVTLWSLRENMGVVPQDPELFNDTILSNIKYANFDATDEQVYEACRAASIHDKIVSFPDGYLSKVGERGVKLSGGELQRVAIARAILKNPKIILLDEATSMVDMETEREIQSAFNQLSINRTMFVIAHRLSTVMNADLIIVIKEGGILEKGTHEQLLKLKGKYYQLWSKQLKNEEPKSPSGSPKDLTLVNNLSPKFREEELKKALEKTGARFHGTDQKPVQAEETQDKEGITLLAPGPSASTVPTPTGTDGKMDLAPYALQQSETYVYPKPVNVHPNVTFAVEQPKSLSRSPQSYFRSPNNLRTSASQGILKNAETKNAEKQPLPLPRPVAPKAPSSLKPDAREFVPNEPLPSEYNSRGTTSQPLVIHTASTLSAHKTPRDGDLPGATPGAPNFNNLSAGDKHSKKDAGTQNLAGGGERAKHDRSHTDKIQTLQEKIDKALKSSEARMKEMEEEKTAQESLRRDTASGMRDAPGAHISIPDADGERQGATDTEQSPLSPAESQNELFPEPKKRRRRNRRRSNKSKSSSEDMGGVTVAESHGHMEPSPDEPTMTNISPRSENEVSLPNMDGEGSSFPTLGEKKPRRRFRSGSKAYSPAADSGEPSSSLRQTVSAEGLSKQYRGKGRASSIGESNYRAISREGLRPNTRDGERMPALLKPTEPPTIANSTSNGNPLRESGRRKAWGKSTAFKGSWRKSDKDERGDRPNPPQSNDSANAA